MDYVDTILTSSDANNFFGTANRLCDSNTLEATLRYIAIKSNGGDIEKVKLINASMRQADYNVTSGNVYTEERFDDIELLIITPRGRGEELLSINAGGWISLDTPPYPVAVLLSARAPETRIYVNNEKKRAIVFVKTPTENWCDLFASCLFRVLPWRFGSEAEGAALAQAIAKNQPEVFKNIINGCSQNFNFANYMARRTLLGWASGQRAAQLDVLQRKMEDCLASIRQEEQRIAQYLDQYNAANENFIALSKGSMENDDSFYNFFVSHKQLSIYRVTNSNSGMGGKMLDYCVLETIEYYDEDNFMNNYNTPASNIGRCGNDMRRILYGIFKEHKGVIRAEAIFRLTNLSSLTVVSGTTTGKHNSTHLRHPHLVNHGCLGGNGTQINRYMEHGDWDLAIEQSIAAVKNVNMGDAVVISSMIRDLTNAMDSCSCIIAENGQAMTPRQFLQYLREGDNNEGNTNG